MVVPVRLRRRRLPRSAMTTPELVNATPLGASSFFGIAPSPSNAQLAPTPATVEIDPAALTYRTAQLPRSATTNDPSPSTATSTGSLRRASVAGPPSPEKVQLKLPAT